MRTRFPMTSKLAAFLFPAVLAGATACVPLDDDSADYTEDELGESSHEVVSGTIEPDYLFPWQVRLSTDCGGVLIAPRWVLTAAHCVPAQYATVFYNRTDGVTGYTTTETRLARPETGKGKVYRHSGYSTATGNPVNDIALIKIEEAFELDQYIQTVGLPTGPLPGPIVGAVANPSQNQNLPAGKVAVMRTTAPACDTAPGKICIAPTSGALCAGDSGSGFVTLENGRASVRGIVSESSNSCTQVDPGNIAKLTDVWAYRDWIMSTMAQNDTQLNGNTRLRLAGRQAHGIVALGCTNAYAPSNQTMYGPTDVAGIQLGAECQRGATTVAMCQVDSGQTGGIMNSSVIITKFTKTMTDKNGTVTTVALPINGTGKTYASYVENEPNDLLREFTCTVGLASPVVRPPVFGGVITRL